MPNSIQFNTIQHQNYTLAAMGPLSKINLDPVSTPGIFHVENLTEQSADITSRILQANRANHIFTSSEKEMGVSTAFPDVAHSLELGTNMGWQWIGDVA